MDLLCRIGTVVTVIDATVVYVVGRRPSSISVGGSSYENNYLSFYVQE
jgi:hypothetical protein